MKRKTDNSSLLNRCDNSEFHDDSGFRNDSKFNENVKPGNLGKTRRGGGAT
jgi:hypothetical protein